ncbi:hypothetical protein Droror1_Dr00006171 [Drosera rotundifolia]
MNGSDSSRTATFPSQAESAAKSFVSVILLLHEQLPQPSSQGLYFSPHQNQGFIRLLHPIQASCFGSDSESDAGDFWRRPAYQNFLHLLSQVSWSFVRTE